MKSCRQRYLKEFVSPLKGRHISSFLPPQTKPRGGNTAVVIVDSPAGRCPRRDAADASHYSVRPRPAVWARSSLKLADEVQKIINALFPLRARSLGCGTRPFQRQTTPSSSYLLLRHPSAINNGKSHKSHTLIYMGPRNCISLICAVWL